MILESGHPTLLIFSVRAYKAIQERPVANLEVALRIFSASLARWRAPRQGIAVHSHTAPAGRSSRNRGTPIRFRKGDSIVVIGVAESN